MISSFSASVSGVRAHATRVEVSGHDVANVNTPNFAQSRPVQTAQRNGTEISALQKVPSQSPEYSATDLAEEAVEQIEGSAGYAANLQTIKTQDAMLGDLLDLFA